MAGSAKKDIRRSNARNAGASSPRGDGYVAQNLGEGAVAVQGDYNNVEYKHITNVYGNTPPSVEEEAELQRMKGLVPQKIAELKSALAPRKLSGENPYHLLEALNVHEDSLLAGRQSILDKLTASLDDKRFAALSGENGLGKTSLLRAGLIPGLVDAGHWPIRIEVGNEAVEAAVKKAVFGSLEGFPRLAAHPLRDVLQLASAFIPNEKDIVLLVDNLEELFKRPAETQAEFARAWKECVNDPALNARWLFCMTSVTHHLSQFQSGELNPFASLAMLGPLDREAAKEAIAAPARAAGIRIEDALVETLASDLGGDEVEPARLQIACYMLALGERAMTLDGYRNAGRLDGLLQVYLNDALKQISLENREPAWQALSLIEEESGPIGADEIERLLSSFGYWRADVKSLLKTLEVKRLVVSEEAGYRLASESWRKPIRDWRKREAIPRQIQKEAARQALNARRSALRGLIGGAIGMAFFNEIVYIGAPLSWDIALFFTVVMISIGGIAGITLTLLADLTHAAYGSRRWFRYLVGGASGAGAFFIGLFLYVNSTVISDFETILRILFEGSLWGAAIGLGLTWGLETKRPVGLAIVATSLAAGIVLMGADMLGGALDYRGQATPPARVFLGGAVAPLVFLAAALAVRDYRRKENGK